MKREKLFYPKSTGGNILSKSGVENLEPRAKRQQSRVKQPKSGLRGAGLELVSRSPEETQEIGKEIGRLAEGGDLYLLIGNLGAGKTCLTQGIAWGLGVKGFISSPSFVILREYQGRLPLYHADLYRMRSLEEIRELGLDDYLYGKGTCVVEWANRGWDYLVDYMCIEIGIISETERLLSFSFQGERYSRIAVMLRDKPGILIGDRGQHTANGKQQTADCKMRVV